MPEEARTTVFRDGASGTCAARDAGGLREFVQFVDVERVP